MSALLIFIFIAFLLLWALLAFLDADHSTDLEDVSTPSAGHFVSCGNQEFASLGHLIFSHQDWDLIQRERSPSLNKLFVKERRAVITHWLHESAARFRAIRANHVQNSRRSANLDVFAELRLLFLFSYLAFLCWAILLIARFCHPSTSGSLALHLQSTAGRLLALAPRIMAPAASGQRPFSSP